MRILFLTSIFLLAMFVGYAGTLLALMVFDQVEILANPTPAPKSIKGRKDLPSKELLEQAYEAARHQQIDPVLVFALIKIESNWKLGAVGLQGELGLMQIHPKWHSGATTSTRINLAIGSRYLKSALLECGPLVFDGLRCYNGGISKRTINKKRRASGYAKKVEKEYQRIANLLAWDTRSAVNRSK